MSTLVFPRNENCFSPSALRMFPKTVSTIPIRLLYKYLPVNSDVVKNPLMGDGVEAGYYMRFE